MRRTTTSKTTKLSPIILPEILNMSFSSPIIRVSRKRSADPRSALVVEVKRQKHDQLFFSLFKTSDAPVIKEPSTIDSPVIDFQQSVPEADSSNPLAFATYCVDEIGGPEPQPSKVDTEVITVNGRALVPVSEKKEDVVYDFYKIVRGEVEGEGFDDWTMRFATKAEEMLVFEKDDESDVADDDDDSNDENNWRNDYPDEDEGSSGSEDDREAWDHHEDCYDSQCSSDDDGLRLRMQRFGLTAETHSDSDDD